MASTLKVQNIQHTGGIATVSIDSAGQVSLPNTTMIQQWQLWKSHNKMNKQEKK